MDGDAQKSHRLDGPIKAYNSISATPGSRWTVNGRSTLPLIRPMDQICRPIKYFQIGLGRPICLHL